MKILSVDAETNGLWGNPFAIAGIVYEDGSEIERICVRLPDSAVSTPWGIKNVIPAIKKHPATHQNYEEMLKCFANFYNKHKDSTVLWHMGHIVEAHLFREMYRIGAVGEWDAPYTPIELSTALLHAGYEPSSEESYAKKNGICLDGVSHDPQYDAELAALVYFDIKNRFWFLK